MKELDYPPHFWGRVYWDFHDFPKKFWGLGAPPPMGPGTPQMPYFVVPGPIRGGALRPQIFFWEVQEVLIDSAPKIRWVVLVQLLHGFFLVQVIGPKSLLVNHRVKLRLACQDSKQKQNLKIFHLVKFLGLKDWEKTWSQNF